MMRSSEQARRQSPSSPDRADDYRYFCRLFDDMVFRHLCLLRRRELNGKAGFSCAACSKDTLMNSRCGRGYGPAAVHAPHGEIALSGIRKAG